MKDLIPRDASLPFPFFVGAKTFKAIMSLYHSILACYQILFPVPTKGETGEKG